MSEPARVAVATPRPIWYGLASILLLVPCYWQPRIQAGDLSSHLYNSWLAGLIQSGRIHGLHLVHQNTNILFDLILSGLLQLFGPDWAQRLSVSLCVLALIWGAFAFVTAVSGRLAWQLLPCLAILAYGWAFHVGFFNFYLSLGLCFWSLAALRRPSSGRMAVAVILLAVAYTAHALPVLWAIGLVAYEWIAGKITGRFRAHLVSVSLALLVLAHVGVRWRLPSRWSVTQLASATGADQLLVFDSKYGYLLAALLLFWTTCLAELVFTHGGRKVAQSIPLQWCLLTAAGVFILPTAILIPGFRHALVYIAERMSLAVGICVCALIGATPLRGIQRYAPGALAIVFFALLFSDERNLNRFEDRVDAAVAQLPPMQRVVDLIADSSLRANAVAHMIDRACVTRCFSYANYEPSTAQFRIRANQPNPYVISDYADSFDMQNGRYIFKPGEMPVYAVDITKSGEITTRSLQAGQPGGISEWRVLQTR